MSSSLLHELEMELGESGGALEHEQEAQLEFEVEGFEPRPPKAGTILLTRFGPASATLTAEHKAIVRRIIADLVPKLPLSTATDCVFIEIEGHEDEIGDPANFGRKGAERAKAVLEEMKKTLAAAVNKLPAARRLKVLQQQLSVKVLTAGPVRPIRSNVTSEGQAMNRRVEVRLEFGTCPGITPV